MTDGRPPCDCHQLDILEGTSGHTASCNRLERQRIANKLKPVKTKKPIDKVGKKNLFECSDGEKVTQAEINKRLDDCYGQLDRQNIIYENNLQKCEGCGGHATCHAHIVPKARAKQLRKTDLIWTFENIFESCFTCNTIAENVSSVAITKLKNYERIKNFLIENDYERATKLPDFKLTEEPHKI